MAKNIKANVAIVSLGRVGSAFLEKFITKKMKGIKLVAVEINPDAPGVKIARKKRTPILTDINDLLAMGESLEIIFDLTGNEETRKKLRKGLLRSKNQNTVIAPEVIARLIWDLMAKGKKLPAVHSKKGY